MKTCSKCKGCNNKSKRILNVDHCHKTGKVRGLLCCNCNRALGMVKDSVDTLKNLIEYLGDNNE